MLTSVQPCMLLFRDVCHNVLPAPVQEQFTKIPSIGGNKNMLQDGWVLLHTMHAMWTFAIKAWHMVTKTRCRGSPKTDSSIICKLGNQQLCAVT